MPKVCPRSFQHFERGGMMFVSNAVKEFCIPMLETPSDWSQGYCEFANIKHPDVKVWTANGYYGMSIGHGIALGFFEKRYIRDCILMSQSLKCRGRTCYD